MSFLLSRELNGPKVFYKLKRASEKNGVRLRVEFPLLGRIGVFCRHEAPSSEVLGLFWSWPFGFSPFGFFSCYICWMYELVRWL